MTVNSKLMTADDLLRLPEDHLRHELVRGQLRTMPLSGLDHGDIASVLDGSLGPYVRRRKQGRVFVGGTGFLLTSDPDTVRATDLAFVRQERLAPGKDRAGYFPGAPDLAVEIFSPHDRYLETAERVGDWLDHGTQLVFVVSSLHKTVTIHRPGDIFLVLGMDAVLSAGDVVPGWTLPVRELFELE